MTKEAKIKILKIKKETSMAEIRAETKNYHNQSLTLAKTKSSLGCGYSRENYNVLECLRKELGRKKR